MWLPAMGRIELNEFRVITNISVSVNNKPEQQSLENVNLKIVFQWLYYCLYYKHISLRPS